GGRRGLPGGGLPAAGIHAHGAGGLVLLRRHLAADRGRGGDGLHRPDPGAPHVAPVRQFAEEGEPEGRQEVGHAPTGAAPKGANGRPGRRFRARVARGRSARQSSARAGQGGPPPRPASPGPSPEHGHTPHAGPGPLDGLGFQTTRNLAKISSSLRRGRVPWPTTSLETASWRVLPASTCLPRSTSGWACKASTALAVPV